MNKKRSSHLGNKLLFTRRLPLSSQPLHVQTIDKKQKTSGREAVMKKDVETVWPFPLHLSWLSIIIFFLIIVNSQNERCFFFRSLNGNNYFVTAVQTSLKKKGKEDEINKVLAKGPKEPTLDAIFYFFGLGV